MSPQLQDLFDRGLLLRPSDHHPNLIHLIRALYTLAGVPDMHLPPPARQLLDLIGPADHLIFILLDGLGMNIVQHLPSDCFIRSHLQTRLHSTCPSTTACALTALATTHYPNRHGVTGWFTHLPEFGLTAMILPFAERFSNEPLARRGLRAEDVLPLPAVCPRMTHKPTTLLPAPITNTIYATYSRGGTPGLPYRSIPHAFDQIIAHITAATQPTYTHLYLPEVDTLCHKLGATPPAVISLVLQIDSELSRLVRALEGRARIIVSADHGLIDVPEPHQTLLFVDDPLLPLLQVPPSGDARMPIFHVRPDRRDEFVDSFNQRFADRMLLLDIDQVERHELFGPGPLSPASRRRFGDFVAISYRPATLAHHPPNKPLGHLYVAQHAGLSPEEILIPLCIA